MAWRAPKGPDLDETQARSVTRAYGSFPPRVCVQLSELRHP